MTNYFLTYIGQNERNGIENSTKKSLSIREIENAINSESYGGTKLQKNHDIL